MNWKLHGLILAGLALAAQAEYNVGSYPPDFTCTDWNGNSWSLYEHRGKVVLVNFGATWCGPCNAEMPELQENFFEYYDPERFSIVHLDTDNDPVQQLITHWGGMGVTFPVLTGCASNYNAYGNGYIPYNCLFDTEGQVLYADSGYNPNALHQLILANMPVDYPLLEVDGFTIESDGNYDGRPDAGEAVSAQLVVRCTRRGTPASNVSITLTTDSPSVTVSNGTVDYPDLAEGATASGMNTFQFTVAEDLIPHWSTFTFTYTASFEGVPTVMEIAVPVRLGRPDLLIVDSDGSADNNETFMATALDALSINHDIWDNQTSPLATDEMNRYSRIIWLGGSNESDINNTQEAGLREFMDNGGQLLLSSQYLSDNPNRADFLEEYFGVTVTNPNAASLFIVDGVVNDPWFNGTAMVLTGNQGANNCEEPDILELTGPSTVFGTWRQASNAPAAVYTVRPNYAAMFCGFPIEATRVFGAVPGSMNMQAFLEHALPFFENATALEAPAPELADGFHLSDAHPNPFNPATTLEYTLSGAADIGLVVYNALGQEVLRLTEGRQSAGTYSRTLDGSNWASGLYLAQLEVDGQARSTRKLMLIK